MPDRIAGLVEYLAVSQRDFFETANQFLILLAGQRREQLVCNGGSLCNFATGPGRRFLVLAPGAASRNLHSLALGDVFARHDHPRRAVSGEGRDGQIDPAPAGRRIADVLVVEQRALASDHLTNTRRDRRAVRAFVAAGLVAGLEIIVPLRNFRPDAPRAGGESERRPVRHDDGASRVEHADLDAKRVESVASQASRLLPQRLGLLAQGDIAGSPAVPLELILLVEDRLAADADPACLAGTVSASQLEVAEVGAPFQQPSVRLPIGFAHGVERGIAVRLADDAFVVYPGASAGGAGMRDEAVELVLLPKPVRAQREQAARARLVLAQRRLRLGQQDGAAGLGIHHRINFACLDGPKLGTAFHQPQDAAHGPGHGIGATGIALERGVGAHWSDSFIPSACSTLLLSLRFPTILATGDGDTLVRLGVTTMPSASARCGYSRTSMTSSLNLLPRYSLQITSRLATARAELGALSAMYRRITTTVSTVAPGSLPFSFLAFISARPSLPSRFS